MLYIQTGLLHAVEKSIGYSWRGERKAFQAYEKRGGSGAGVLR